MKVHNSPFQTSLALDYAVIGGIAVISFMFKSLILAVSRYAVTIYNAYEL